LAKKKRIPPVVHPPTKRQLSHWQQQKRRQRIIFSAGMVVIAAVMILIGSGVFFGWYVPVYRPLHEVVTEVNGAKFNMSYLLDFVTNTYGQYASMALDYGLSDIQDNALLRQEAASMGITVTEKEIDDALKGTTGEQNAALRDFVRAQLLSSKLKDEYFEPQLPATAEQRHVFAMFVESQSKANEAIASIKNGTDFGLLAGELSLDTTTKSDKGDLGFHPREVIPVLMGSTEITDAIFNQPVGELGVIADKTKTKQLGYWIVKVTERNETDGQSHVFGMMLSSEEEAIKVKDRLNAGEDFTKLAQEFSQVWSDENKDDLGWVPADSTDAAAEFIFNSNIPLTTVSPPIKDTNNTTKGGYWVIKIDAAENRAISEEDRDTMMGILFNDWLEELKANPDNKIESYFDDNRKEWAVDYLQSLES
jgi:parvulin-like peptidyl-prolyl isomerase